MNKLTKKFTFLIYGTLALLIFGSTALAQFKSNLSAKSWSLTKINGAKINAPKATLSFDLEKNTIGGNGGCNGFGGNLEKNGNRITMSQIISTKMFCEATSAVENKFLGNLERITSYRIKGGKLILFAGKTAVLEFTAKK